VTLRYRRRDRVTTAAWRIALSVARGERPVLPG